MLSLWCLVQASFRKEISWRGSRCWGMLACVLCVTDAYGHSLRPQLGMIWIEEKRGNGQREILLSFCKTRQANRRTRARTKGEIQAKEPLLYLLTEDVRDEQVWRDTGEARDRLASAWQVDLIWHTWLRAETRLTRWVDPWRNAQASSVHKTSWMNLI